MDGNKKIVINKKSIIYIMAPANAFTGGPELLHQIAINIKKNFRVNTKMFYLPSDENEPIHKNFKKYNLEFTNFIEDDEKNILIIPEHFMFLKYSMKFKKIKKILWWLSIDNYFGYKFRFSYKKLVRSIIKIPYNLCGIFNKITNYYFGIFTFHDYLKLIYSFSNLKDFKELKQIDLHLSQSIYASNYLKKFFKNIKFLSDYQRQDILKNINKKRKEKKNIICYSHKSNKFIKKIENIYNFKMIKLSGLNTNQLINIYKKTKIYMDFGYHPGKDRMPREAVLFDNCILTNKKGSAKNKFDIPINEKYKFDENISNIEKINKTINKIFENYKSELKNFKNYKKTVLLEKNKFKKDLKKIFIKK